VVFEDKIPRTPDELFQPEAMKAMCRIIDKYVKTSKCTNKSGLDEFSYNLSQEKTSSFPPYLYIFKMI
jgi:hypothetical protein